MFALNLVYISLVFFMVVFSLHLMLTRHGNAFLNRLLGILLVGRALQYLFGWLAQNGQLVELIHVYRLPNIVYYCAPAALYLYIKGFVSDRHRLDRHEWMHFLPSLIGLAEAAHWMFSPPEARYAVLASVNRDGSLLSGNEAFIRQEGSLLLRTAMFLVYIGLSWAYVFRKGIFSRYATNRVGCNWVLTLLALATIGHGLLFGSLLWDRLHPESRHAGFLTAVRFSILIYLLIMLFVFKHPRVMYGYAFVAEALDPPYPTRLAPRELQQSFDNGVATGTVPDREEGQAQASTQHRRAASFVKEGPPVSKERVEAWKQSLAEYMEAEKPFLNRAFRLHHLSETLDIPSHHLSYIINIEFGMNFNQWVNEYRVGHFISLYRQHAATHTLEALARDSGFANRRTLHNAFIRIHGQPPGLYLQRPPTG